MVESSINEEQYEQDEKVEKEKVSARAEHQKTPDKRSRWRDM